MSLTGYGSADFPGSESGSRTGDQLITAFLKFTGLAPITLVRETGFLLASGPGVY